MQTTQQTKKINLHDQMIDYDKIKAQAIKNSPVVASYPLSAIELGRNKIMKIEGKIVPTTDKSYFKFLKNVLQINPSFVARFKEVTDEKTEMSMLKALKIGMAMRKDTQVNILANPKTKVVTAFASGKHSFRTNESLLDIFENVMNQFPDLKLKDFYMEESGSMAISARTDNVSKLLMGEEFRGGITFRNNYENGSTISRNAFRMICENGMYGFSDVFFNVGSNGKQIDKFFDDLKELNVNQWIDPGFKDKILNAKDMNASLAELKSAKGILMSNSSIKENEIDVFLPEYKSANKWLASKKVDVERLNTKQWKNCPTNANLWDVINRITYFGSHDYGFDADFDKIQNSAGMMFYKPFDMADQVILN